MKLESDVARRPKEVFLCAFLSILGLSFWFFLGFPFANENESYGWIVQMNRISTNILDVLRWSPAANYRPLGSMTAWLGFRLSSGSIYPQQAFNFMVAILAWLILYSAIIEKKLFSWISFVVGGIFFSGYIYLFHLHGVFYSPLLVFIAILTGVSLRNGFITNPKLAVIFTLAIVTSLFHPFALLIYIAFTLGYFFEKQHARTRIQLAMDGLFLIIALVLLKILIPTRGMSLPSEWVLGLSTSYKLLELKSGFSVISWLLAVTTVLSLSTSWRVKVITSIIVTVFSLVLVFLNQPVLIIWIAVCLVKTVLLKKWSLAFLIISTAILPVATATGSPTYAIFVLMVCSAVTPFRWSLFVIESAFHKKIVFAILILGVLVSVLLRSNVHLPVISELVNPILGEREKTFQLESIIKWWKASDYIQYRLVLCQSADNPVKSTNAVNRKNRPPTSQVYLDQYTSSLAPLHNENMAHQLLVCFGDEKIADAELVYTIPGKYNGQATVYNQHK
jgi:hypothetical protein